MSKMESVQDILIQDLLQTSESKSNETIELFNFMKESGTPLTQAQIESFMLLREYGLDDIADFAYNARRSVTPASLFFKILDKLTMADRIKGNAKLSHLFKANANPANGALRPEEVQAQGMSRREIDR